MQKLIAAWLWLRINRFACAVSWLSLADWSLSKAIRTMRRMKPCTEHSAGPEGDRP
jgi:hypothetical protein